VVCFKGNFGTGLWAGHPTSLPSVPYGAEGKDVGWDIKWWTGGCEEQGTEWEW